MLTNPEAGWTEFHLEGTHTYTLSYTDRIASDWMGQAIHGLETMLPCCSSANISAMISRSILMSGFCLTAAPMRRISI